MPYQEGNDEVDSQGSSDGGAPRIPPDQPSGERAQRGTDDEQNKQINNLKRNVFVAFVVAALGPLLAIAALVFSGLQWQVMRDQSALTRNEQRAWIHIVDVRGIHEANKAPCAMLSVINNGHTPARDLALTQGYHLAPRGSPVDFSRMGSEEAAAEATAQRPSPNTVWPGVTLDSPCSNSGPLKYYSAEVLAQIASGEVIEYTFGRITYKDVFGNGHWITFCYRYVPALSKHNAASHQAATAHQDYVWCEHHNEIGDD